MLGNTIASIKSTFGSKLGFFLFRSSLPPAGSSFWPTCSGTTTCLSATEKNKIGYVTVPCLYKMTEHNSIADWMKL